MLERAVPLVPQTMGDESALALLAGLAQERGDVDARARRSSTRWSRNRTPAIESARKLMTLGRQANQPARARAGAERVLTLDPFDGTAHAEVGRAALAAGDIPAAITRARARADAAAGRHRDATHRPGRGVSSGRAARRRAQARDPGARAGATLRAGAGAAPADSGRTMTRTRTRTMWMAFGAAAIVAAGARRVAGARRRRRRSAAGAGVARPPAAPSIDRASSPAPSARSGCAGASRASSTARTTPTASAPATGAIRGPSTARRPSRTCRAASAP